MVDAVSDADEIPLQAGTPVLDAYLTQLNLLLDSGKEGREVAVAFAQRMGSKHFLSVLGTITEMDRLYREMHSVLKEFTGRRSLLFTVLTIEHLAMVMKLYVISWHTMLDLVARLVSATFDLGIADRDVSMRLILNNDHVKSSRIPEILQAYEKALPGVRPVWTAHCGDVRCARRAHGRASAEGRRPAGIQHGLQAGRGAAGRGGREDGGRAQS